MKVSVARRTWNWLPLIKWWWNLLLSSYSYVLIGLIYRTWSRWHLWLPIFTLGQELFRLVFYVEKSKGQLCVYMYNSYNLKSNCTWDNCIGNKLYQITKTTTMNQKLNFMHKGHIDIYKTNESKLMIHAYTYTCKLYQCWYKHIPCINISLINWFLKISLQVQLICLWGGISIW
jgi:hypothetical protein